MTRLFILLTVCGLLLSGCRYWVLYEFADQFCEFEEYIDIDWLGEPSKKQVAIGFTEPVLNRHILLRYLNADPFSSVFEQDINTKETRLVQDEFAFQQTYYSDENLPALFQFYLAYHPLDEHALLESAQLDTRLSELFSPALVEPILRSLCSEDYDLSLKQLDMRFTLSNLPTQNLPKRKQLIEVFGQAQETNFGAAGEQVLQYEFDFMTKGMTNDKQEMWLPQQKPIIMLFTFDSQDQLKKLYIHYHKYAYWLDVESLSGRLLVIRRDEN